jgi:hypothetical protein
MLREDPCLLPTLFARNSKPALLDTLPTDRTRLWIRQREERITNELRSAREDHLCDFLWLNQSGLPNMIEEAANH